MGQVNLGQSQIKKKKLSEKQNIKYTEAGLNNWGKNFEQSKDTPFFVVKCFADDAMIYRCKSEVTVYSVGKNKKGKKRHQLKK